MEDQAIVELKPCPFCGRRPIVEKRTELDMAFFSVRCRNKACPVMPATKWHSKKDWVMYWWGTYRQAK